MPESAHLAYLPQLRELFIAHHVVLAYVFGSQAEGRAGPLSDIDIAALLAPQVPREQWDTVQLGLLGELMSLFRRNDIDLIILNHAPPTLLYDIVKHGQIIYEDPATRPAVDLTVHAISRYADTIPLRNIQRHYLFERIAERKQQRRQIPLAE